MDPWRTYLQALLATERARNHLPNVVGVDAFVGHHSLLLLAESAALSLRSTKKGVQRGYNLCALSDNSGKRLTEPERTSPIAKTPGRLVSSGLWMSAPARTKPLSSSITPDRDSQSVLGSAPMNVKRWRIANLLSSPVRSKRQRIASRIPS